MEFKKMGVFSPTESLDSASMIKCLQALHGHYPSIKFTSVTGDKKYGGFRVFFVESDDSIALERNILFSGEQPDWIYPLTTHLIILNLNHKKSPLFERDLRDAIGKKFGRVIEIVKTDNGNQSKNWRIEIDIPEFKSLEASERHIFSDMSLSIPSRNEEVTLKFWCSQCERCGHFQHECRTRTEEENNIGPELKAEENNNNNNAEQGGGNCTEQTSSSSDRKKERTPKKIPLEATEKYAEKIGREEAMSFSKEKKRHVQNNTASDEGRSASSNFLAEKDIKKEILEFAQISDAKEDKYSGSKKSENNSYSKDLASENADLPNKTAGSSSDDDDGVEFIGYLNNSSNKSPPNSAKADARNFEEDSRSSPEARNSSFSSFSFPSIPGTSYEPSATAAASRSPRGAEVTTALSERLQDCINQVCTKSGVLDRKKLDAFLIHVKKKSNPIRVALNYTSNTKGLKEQLQGILHMYYNTPQTGTKEDIQFIKWLNGLVERYDGSIPKKRKRSGKTDDEPSSKK